MKIIESWENQNGNIYAIIKWSKKELIGYNQKQYEALWLDENNPPELCSFAGFPGYRIADFATIKEARNYILNGTSQENENPDIWFEMLKVQVISKRRE